MRLAGHLRPPDRGRRPHAGVVRKIAARRKKRRLVRLDWTDFRSFRTLAASACVGGRPDPLFWTGYTAPTNSRCRNSLEERLLRKLKALLPGSLDVVVVDCVSGRAEWAAVCRELKFHHVVRIKPDVTVSRRRYRGVFREYPAKKGMGYVLRAVDYRKDRRVKHDVVVRRRPDRPKKGDEPWYLMTDLDGRAERLCALYARRMSIQELFHDHKGLRNGQSLRHTKIGRPADRGVGLRHSGRVGSEGEARRRPIGVVHEPSRTRVQRVHGRPGDDRPPRLPAGRPLTDGEVGHRGRRNEVGMTQGKAGFPRAGRGPWKRGPGRVVGLNVSIRILRSHSPAAGVPCSVRSGRLGGHVGPACRLTPGTRGAGLGASRRAWRGSGTGRPY